MHALLAAFFAMLFSASHPAPKPVIQQPVAPQPYTYSIATTSRTSARIAVPRLHSISSYPERACVSYRRTNITYRVR